MIHSLRGILQIQFLEDRYSTGNPAFSADLSNNLLKSRACDVEFFFETNHEGCCHGKPIVTFWGLIEEITQLQGFFQIRHLEDRYCHQTLRHLGGSQEY